MNLSPSDITASATAWFAHAAAWPEHSERLMRQNVHFLVAPAHPPGFHPIRFIVAHAQGIPFTQAGGRSLSMPVWTPRLRALGLIKHDETAPGFDACFDEWKAACMATGKRICRYKGTDPCSGRVFWLAPGPLRAPTPSSK